MPTTPPVTGRCDAERRAFLAVLGGALAGCSGSGGSAGSDEPASPPIVPDATPTWYVDPATGRDDAEGRSATAPLKSPPLQLAEGDRVMLRQGTTLEVLGDYDPGIANVVFDAYALPTDPPTLPKPVWTLSASANFIVWTGDLNGQVFRNIRFAVPAGQTGRPAFRLTIRVPLAVAPVFEGCDFDGDDGAFFADISSDCAGLTFRGCTFTCARGVSFSFGGSAAVFMLATSGARPFAVTGMVWEGNDIRHPQGLGMLIRSGSSSDEGATHFAGKFVDATFRANRWHDCGTSGVFLRCGFPADLRIADVSDHGWDGLLFEDNVIEHNGGSGGSIGPNVRDSRRTTTIQRNLVADNGRLHGTTGGLQLMGLRGALVQDNVCRDNWTTEPFDGVNLFMDIFDEATDEMQTAGAVGCVVRRNRCSGARGAGGADAETWIAEQGGNPNSSNAPSSGIRLYFAHGNQVYANVLTDNGSGIACDKSADNLIFNNTATGCSLGYYDGVGLGTRANRFFNNVSFDNDWDFYGLGTAGWTLPEPSTAEIVLDAAEGTWVAMRGLQQFALVRMGVGGRNFFVRERGDTSGELGLAVVSAKQGDDRIQVHVLRAFSVLRFAAGTLLIGAMEAYLPLGIHHNARHGARLGSLQELVSAGNDLLDAPQLGADAAPLASSPLRGRGSALPPALLVPITDHAGRAFAATPAIGAFELA